MKTIPCGGENNDKAVTRVYSFDEVRKNEGIYKTDGEPSVRFISISSNIGSIVLWFHMVSNDLVVAGDWSAYRFTKTDEKLHLSIK